MNVAESLGQIEALFAADEAGGAMTALAGLVSEVASTPAEERAVALEQIAARIGHPDPRVGARLALACGALVESEISPEPLAQALAEPLGRALSTARRFVDQIALLPESEESDAVAIGSRRLPALAVAAIAQADPAAMAALSSLDIWYRPVVAAWGRDTGALRAAQANPGLREDVLTIGDASQGTHWLSILFEVSLQTPFVVLVPELGEAYEMTLDGVSDCGQLMVLLSEGLADALGRVGASGVAPDEVLAVMRGGGPQEIKGVSYSADFHLYPWRAVDPASGMPQDRRFQWRAPGGVGAHSLPVDFLPGTIEPLRGTRVLVLVGPKAPGELRFTRVIQASRIFNPLLARIDGVRLLAGDEGRAWFNAVRLQLSS